MLCVHIAYRCILVLSEWISPFYFLTHGERTYLIQNQCLCIGIGKFLSSLSKENLYDYFECCVEYSLSKVVFPDIVHVLLPTYHKNCVLQQLLTFDLRVAISCTYNFLVVALSSKGNRCNEVTVGRSYNNITNLTLACAIPSWQQNDIFFFFN